LCLKKFIPNHSEQQSADFGSQSKLVLEKKFNHAFRINAADGTGWLGLEHDNICTRFAKTHVVTGDNSHVRSTLETYATLGCAFWLFLFVDLRGEVVF
jgi:hypothetical protein